MAQRSGIFGLFRTIVEVGGSVTWVLLKDLTGYGLYCDEVFIEEFESTISDLVTVQIILEIIAL